MTTYYYNINYIGNELCELLAAKKERDLLDEFVDNEENEEKFPEIYASYTNKLIFSKFDSEKSLTKNKYGIFEPTKINQSIPDIIFVPMLGFDKNLNRIGYGKGYYDKTISKLRNLKKIFVVGLAYDNQMVKCIPTENHDEKMDLIITDKKIYR